MAISSRSRNPRCQEMSVCRSFYRQHTLSWPVIHQELQRADGRPDHDADLPGEIVGAHPAQPKIGGCPQASRSNLSACEVGAASRGTGKAKEAPMAGSWNKAILVGKLGRAPEARAMRKCRNTWEKSL